METHLQILQARRKVLSTSPPPASHPFTKRIIPRNDPFSHESHGFHIASRFPQNSENDVNQLHGSSNAPARRTGRASRSGTGGSRRVAKGVKKRARRFVTNWTPEMDKIVRKGLGKYGWGSWTRIASSGKLPKEYNAKLIASRAKSIGLTKEMFGPQVVPMGSKFKS